MKHCSIYWMYKVLNGLDHNTEKDTWKAVHFFFSKHNGKCLLFGKSHFLALFLAEVLFWPLKCHALRVRCLSQYIWIIVTPLGEGKHLLVSGHAHPAQSCQLKGPKKDLDENAGFLDVIFILNKTSRNKASFGVILWLNTLQLLSTSQIYTKLPCRDSISSCI